MKRILAVSLACIGVGACGLLMGCSSTGMATFRARASGISNYVEREHNGRYYVMGSDEAIKEFESSKSLPFTKTKIGEGPGGATVVLEVDKRDDAYANTLWRIFKSRHNL